MADDIAVEDEFAGVVSPFEQEDEFAGVISPFEDSEPAAPKPSPYALIPINDLRDNISNDDRTLVDASDDPDDIYSTDALNMFFKDQYVRTDKTPNTSLEKGRVIYNDRTLDAKGIYARIQQDISTGEIKERLDNAEWLQYGFTDKIASTLTELNNSAFVDNLSHWTRAGGEGLVKAVGGMAVGTASLILPKAAEDAIGLDKARGFLEDVEGYSQERITSSFEDGDMGSFIGKSLASMGGDMYGNLLVMKNGLKAANALTGGKLTLIQKDRMWKDMAKNTSLKASVYAAMTFAKTDGTLEERTKASTLTLAYMMSPVASSAMGSNVQAVIADIAINSGITALTGQYDDMVENAKDEAELMGNPDDWQAVLFSNLIQVAGPDVVFGALTRSSRGLRRKDARAKTVESARLLKPYSDQGLDRFKTAMEEKHGSQWLSKMDDVDRMAYESRRASNSALLKGELPPALENVQKDFSPRVVIPEAGRLEIEGDKKVWRDSKSILRGVDGRIEQSQGDGKYILTPENTNLKEPVTVSEEAALKMDDADFKIRRKLNTQITKAIPATVEARFAESIQDLQDMINTDTGAKSAWRLQQQKDFLARNPDIHLPAKILKKLQQTNIQQISTSELKDIASEIERLTQQGKVSLKTRQIQEKRSTKDSVSQIASTAKAPKGGVKIETGAKEMKAFAGMRYVFGTGALRPWNLVDMLDGGKAKYNGEAFKKLIDEPNDSYSKYLRLSDSRLRGGEGFIRGIGLKVKALNVKHKVGGTTFTVDELLSVYASSKNRLMHNAVLHGNFKGDESSYKQAVDIVSNDASLKALGDYIVFDYATNYDRVRRAYIKNENKILGQEENYVPMVRMGDEKAKTMTEIANDLAGRAESSKKLPDNKFTIDRVNVPTEFQSAVKLGLYNQWERSVNDQERYINMFASVKQMNAITKDPALRKQIQGAYGTDYIKSLDSYTEAYANPMSVYDTTSFSNYSRSMRKRTAAGFLAYNFVTMAKQVPSITLYLGQGGARNMLLSLDDFNSSWKMQDGKLQNDLIKFVESKDPQVEHAHLERELMELKVTDKGAYDKIVGSMTNLGMTGIAALDKTVRTIGWYSVFQNSLQQGKTEAQAVKDARNATMRTQPTASAKDLPDMYKQGEIANWFLMFSNQLNQLWNLGTYQFPKNVMKDKKAAFGVASGLMVNAISMYIINNHKVPETDDEIMEMMTDTALATIPLFGSAVSGATKGYDTGNPLLASINKSTKKVLAAKDRGDNFEDMLPDLMRNLTPFHGIPMGPLRRIAEGEIFGKGSKDK